MSDMRSHFIDHHDLSGMTLLEVLVACGILVLGLTGIAALLPAASFQLSQATTEDRAGVIAGIAGGDIRSRHLTAADLFSDPSRAIAFGAGAGELASIAQGWFAPTTASYSSRIASPRGFVLEDELIYQPGNLGSPENTFANGMREFRSKVCWAALVLPGLNSDRTGRAAALPGAPATIAIAALRKAPDAGSGFKVVPLYAPAVADPLRAGKFLPPGGCFAMSPQDLQGVGQEQVSVRAAHEADQKRFLGTCSWVLLLPLDPAQTSPAPGRWPIRPIQVNSSWTLRGPGSSEDTTRRSAQLMLRLPDDLMQLDTQGGLVIDQYRKVDATLQRQEIRVVGIANLVRLDQYFLSLD